MTLHKPFRGRYFTYFGFIYLLLSGYFCASGHAASAPTAAQAPGFGEKGAPGAGYHAAFPALYEGEYDVALKRFTSEGRGCIKNGQQRWIDSICYETMVGECYYEMGMLAKALDHYNAAVKLYLAFPNWMLQVQFPATIAASSKRVTVPWAVRPPQARFGRYPDTMYISQGQVDINETVKRGGVVQQALLYPIEAQEIVRCTALAMRRRARLLGPLAQYDPLSEQLITVLSRRPGLPNHWSEAWVNLQLGCALAGGGREGQAVPILQRATVAGGEFAHPLSGMAHLELGRLALARGDYAVASQHLEEASYDAVFYPDPGVVEEAFRYGMLTHLLANRRGLFPPLAPAIAWAKVNHLRQLHASLLLLAAENHAMSGQTAPAVEFLKESGVSIGNRTMKAGRIGARRSYLSALALFQQGKIGEGDAILASAMNYMRQGSYWLFHITLADNLYVSGGATPRTALDLYKEVLRDPRPNDWASDPMEALAVLVTPHPLPYEHWFEVALARKEYEAALECSDRAKRHRFFTTLELGGRMQSLRWVLDGPMEMLDPPTQLQRQDLLTRYPAYDQLRQQADAARKKLAAMPLAPPDQEAAKLQGQGLAELAAIGRRQEILLRDIALRREPATMAFPPLRATVDVQKSLPKGHAMLAFFATSRSYYGFLLNNEKYGFWQIGVTPQSLQRQTTTLLREMGNFAQNHELALKDLNDPKWTQTAGKLLEDLLKGSRADLTKPFDELVVVPDGLLWYVPFEALQVTVEGKPQPLISRFRVRYAPTAGLANGPEGWHHRPAGNTAVVLGKLFPRMEDAVMQSAFDDIAKVLPGCVALKPPLPSPAAAYATLLDRLVVLDDVNVANNAGPYGWMPMPTDQGKAGTTLGEWMALPWGGPEEIVLPGFHTAAEESLKRMARANLPGNEIFLTMCGLMASGARTALVSRWRSGGQTSFDLVREFTQELPHTTPAEAWQRAVLLVIGQRLNLEAEPRVKTTAAETAPRASHPFFWAGYWLVDCSSPASKPEPPPADGPVIKIKPPAKPAPKPILPLLPEGEDVPKPEKPAEEKPAEKPAEKEKPPAEVAEPAAKPEPKPEPDVLGPRIP